MGIHLEELVTSDPEVVSGAPVFKGTRLPVKTLVECFEDGASLSEFLEWYGMEDRREQVEEVAKELGVKPGNGLGV